MTAAEAVAAAASEGLTMMRGNSISGFRYVIYLKRSNRYKAQLSHNGELHSLGSFHAPEQAALCIARWLRDHVLLDQAALAAAASVQGAEAAAAVPAAAEDAALPFFAWSLNGAAAGEPTLPEHAASAATAAAMAAVRLNLPSPSPE